MNKERNQYFFIFRIDFDRSIIIRRLNHFMDFAGLKNGDFNQSI